MHLSHEDEDDGSQGLQAAQGGGEQPPVVAVHRVGQELLRAALGHADQAGLLTQPPPIVLQGVKPPGESARRESAPLASTTVWRRHLKEPCLADCLWRALMAKALLVWQGMAVLLTAATDDEHA